VLRHDAKLRENIAAMQIPINILEILSMHMILLAIYLRMRLNIIEFDGVVTLDKLHCVPKHFFTKLSGIGN
jgi:hypothetical protein